MNVDTIFCRLLLKRIHQDVRKLFPEIRNVVKCVGTTSSRRGEWFVQISSPRRPMFDHNCRAYSATQARCEAWQAFIRKYGPDDYSVEEDAP